MTPVSHLPLDSCHYPNQMFYFLFFFCPQDNQIKYRIFGSRKKGTILESGIVASNGVIHIINKLMDSVAPTVKSQREVSILSRLFNNVILQVDLDTPLLLLVLDILI